MQIKKFKTEREYSVGYLTTPSNPYQPKSIITNLIKSNHNYHMVKDRTGSGATYGVMELANERIILLSPTVQLVKDKENQVINGLFRDTNSEFFYGGQKNKIGECIPVTEGGHLVMGTVDQLVCMNKTKFVEAGYTLVIDELHLGVMGSVYREKLDEPFTNLINEFKLVNRVITITATPLHIYPTILNDFKLIELSSSIKKEREVRITRNLRTFNQIIAEIDFKKRKLLFFSNDNGMLGKIATRFKNNRIATMLGNTLKLKTVVNFGDLNDVNPDVILASSAAMEGLDINLTDADIIIHNRFNTEYGMFTTQTMLQALGRIRTGYNDAYIFMDDMDDNLDVSKVEGEISNMVMTALKNKEISARINVNDTLLVKEFGKYNYTIKLESFFDEIKEVGEMNGSSATMSEMVRNIQTLGRSEFDFNLGQVLNNIHISNKFYGFSPKIGFAFLITGILKLTSCDEQEVLAYMDSDKLGDSISKFKTLLEEGLLSNRFSKDNKSQTIPKSCIISYKSFDVNSVSSEKLVNILNSSNTSSKLKDLLEKFEMLVYTHYPTRSTKKKIADYVKDNYVSTTDGVTMVNTFLLTKYFRSLTKEYKKDNDDRMVVRVNIVIKLLKGIINDDINLDVMITAIKDQFHGADFFNLENDEIREKILTFIVKEGTKQMMNDVKKFGALFVRAFKSGLINKDNRQYSAVTTLPIDIIGLITPNHVSEFDITEAYPTFVNALVGYEGPSVYNNIMKHKRCTRAQAKKEYNTMLNCTDYNISSENRLRFFEKACKYSKELANQVIGFNIKKGDAFRLFASMELDVVTDIENDLSWEYKDHRLVRRHDSLLIFGITPTQKEMVVKTEYPHKNKMIELITKVHVTTR